MLIKIVTDNRSIILSNTLLPILWKDFPDIAVESFNEDNYKDKKKAIANKVLCGARLTPFVAVYNDDKELIKAFYSEVGECTVDNIKKY